VKANDCDSTAVNTWRKPRSQILVLSLRFGGCLANLVPGLKPDEYLPARIHASQIDLCSSLFVLAVTLWNFLVFLAYWLTPE
jgi:hypothetical protein